jgi:hypothetical protein
MRCQVPRSEKYLRSKKKVTVPTIGPSTDAHADAPPKINLVSSANPYHLLFYRTSGGPRYLPLWTHPPITCGSHGKMAAGIDGHATVREVRLGSIGTRRKKAPKGVPSDAAARLHTLVHAVETMEFGWRQRGER